MNRRFLITGLALAGLFQGCAVRNAQVVSPYQAALAAYYRALETGTPADLDIAEKEASAILAADASDHTARILRANVLLSMLRQGSGAPDSVAKLERRFITDLTTVSAGLGVTGDAADWVPARTLVAMGDFLVVKGNAAQKAAEASDELKLAQAKALFDTARQCYSAAAGLADSKKSDATPGLIREGANARSGYLAALRGTLNILDDLDPQLSHPMTGALRADLLQAWETHAAGGSIPAAQPGLNLDASAQDSMRALYSTLGNAGQRQLRSWCAANRALTAKDPAMLTADERKTLDAAVAILRRVFSLSESEALHATLALQLRGAGDNTASVTKMLLFLKDDLQQACAR